MQLRRKGRFAVIGEWLIVTFARPDTPGRYPEPAAGAGRLSGLIRPRLRVPATPPSPGFFTLFETFAPAAR
jgi:hypothetical protein